jgi:hypothetical protein
MTLTIHRVSNGAFPGTLPSVFVSCSATSFIFAEGRVTFPYNSKFERSKVRAMERALQWAQPRGIETIYIEDAPAV